MRCVESGCIYYSNGNGMADSILIAVRNYVMLNNVKTDLNIFVSSAGV